MNTSMHAGIKAYKNAMNTTLTGRQLEAHVLLKAADRLQQVINEWGSDGHESRLRDTISRTQMLWSIFQASLLEPDNPIDDDIKTNVLSLSLFIDRKLFATLADPTPDKLASVIKIHRLLALGPNAQ